MRNLITVVAFSLIFCSSLGGCKNINPLNPLKNNGNDGTDNNQTPAAKQLEDLLLVPSTSIRLLRRFGDEVEVGQTRFHSSLRVRLDDESTNLVAIEESPSPLSPTAPSAFRHRSAWRVSLTELAVTKLWQGDSYRVSAVGGDSSISLISSEGNDPPVPHRRIVFEESTGWQGKEDVFPRPTSTYDWWGVLTSQGDAILWEFQGYPSDGKYLWNRDGSMKTLPAATQTQLRSFGPYRGLRIKESGVPGMVIIEADYRGIGQGVDRGILELDTGKFSPFPAELGSDSHIASVKKWWVAKKEGRIYWQREDDKKNVFYITLTGSAVSSLPLPQEVLLAGGSERGGFWGQTPSGETVFYRPRTAKLTQIKPEIGWKFIQPVYEGQYGLWIRQDQKALGLTKLE